MCAELTLGRRRAESAAEMQKTRSGKQSSAAGHQEKFYNMCEMRILMTANLKKWHPNGCQIFHFMPESSLYFCFVASPPRMWRSCLLMSRTTRTSR